MLDEDCAICGEHLSTKYSVSINCNHTYHYECIMKTFLSSKIGNHCPLCRKGGGMLPIVNGLHKLNPRVHCIDINVTYKSKPCSVILKSGKRKGFSCDSTCMLGYDMCKRHRLVKTNKKQKLGDALEQVQVEQAIDVTSNVSKH